MDIRRIAAENIRVIRQKRGISQETLATKAGISLSYIGYVERGEKAVTIVVLQKIARVLKVGPEILIQAGAHRHIE